MVGAHMHEFRLARFALGLPVLGRPGQFGARRIRIGRPVEEIVKERPWPCRGAGRIRQRGGIGSEMSGILSWVTKPVSASVSAVPQRMIAATLVLGLDHFLYNATALGTW